MSQRQKHFNFWIYLGVICAVYLISFPLAAALAGSPVSTLLIGIWPKYDTLYSYCLSATCAYAPSFVGTVYILHIAISLIFFVATVIKINSSGARGIPNTLRAIFITVFMSGLSIVLISIEFDFETPRFSIYENSVASSYFGIFRAMWTSLTLCGALLSFWLLDNQHNSPREES